MARLGGDPWGALAAALTSARVASASSIERAQMALEDTSGECGRHVMEGQPGELPQHFRFYSYY